MSISSWSASSRWRFAGSEREQPGRRPFIAAPRHQLIGADKCARGFVQRGQFGFGHRRNGQPDTDTFGLGTCPLNVGRIEIVEDQKGVSIAEQVIKRTAVGQPRVRRQRSRRGTRSEEHTSEIQSLLRISYAVSCLKKKKQSITNKKI